MRLVHIIRSVLATAAIAPAAAWPGCIYQASCCATESCGLGCDPPYEYGPRVFCCETGTNSDECCQCVQQTSKCHCTFSDGHGSVSDHNLHKPSLCVNARCGAKP